MTVFLSYVAGGVSLFALTIRKLRAKFVPTSQDCTFVKHMCNVLTGSLGSLILLLFPFPHGFYFILMFAFCKLPPILFGTRQDIN